MEGAIKVSRLRLGRRISGNLQVSGREDAKRVLKSIYRDLKSRTSVTTQVVNGFRPGSVD